jgi:hypothetical protein
MVSVDPDTVQTPVVALVYATGRPESEVAVRVSGPAVRVEVVGRLKVRVWVAFTVVEAVTVVALR